MLRGHAGPRVGSAAIEVMRTISTAELNRATLARQLLLARHALPVVEAVDRLAGLQAQQPRPPFVGLHVRLDGFTREQLLDALARRELVRATSMRTTLHLLAAERFRELRPALQPALDKGIAMMRKRTSEPEVEHALALALEHFEQPATFESLRERLLAACPGCDERALAYVIRCSLPLVQLPSHADRWGFAASSELMLAERWLDAPLAADDELVVLVRHYLAAFGPASVADAQTWSGVPGLRSTFALLRDELLVLRDERGRELFDLPDAPRPDADVPAPVRLLPEFDNLVLAHDDRTRIVDDAQRGVLVTKNLQVLASVLIDGRVAGTWKLERKKSSATLSASLFAAPSRAQRDELAAEAERVIAFVEPDARADLQITLR